jgi:leader peptidase (prepilin peptidase)/N-methyltransferase
MILLLYITFGIQEKCFIYAVLVSALIVATFIDLRTGEIPDEITLGGLVLGLAISFAFPAIFDTASRVAALKLSAIGAIAGGGAILAMAIFGKLLFRKEAMGGGDVKLMAFIGSLLGWKLALLTFFIAPFFGALVGIPLKLMKGNETIPYGPYLSLGAVIAIFYGHTILRILFAGL